MNFILNKKIVLFCILIFVSTISMYAQDARTSRIWSNSSDAEVTANGIRYTIPNKYKTLKLNVTEMKTLLAQASIEPQATSQLKNGLLFYMPMPDGSYSRFQIFEYYVLHPDLAKKYPEIKTYTGQGIDDPSAIIKIDLTPLGFHAMVHAPSGSIFIDPYHKNTVTDYICYNKNDLVKQTPFSCDQLDEQTTESILQNNAALRTNGTQLRTYRLALSCTGEYAAFFGGTVSGATAGMTTTMNRVNGVYETELSIRLVMVSNNNLITYTNSATDPFTNGNGSTMLGQNQTTCDNVIGSANYDIGHVLSTGGGGVAGLGVICSSGNKARGVTGSGSPTGDSFDIDYVAHEMGHQFGGSHTFNSATGSCSGNRTSSAAFEPGSGITIQAYAGICGADNLSTNSIAYFHGYSLDQMITYSTTGTGNNCPVTTANGNTAPVITNMAYNCSIPISTPFILTGAATDANGDAITYSWEERDLGPAGAWNVQSTTAPQFRTFTPSPSPFRIFPKISDIINNTTTIGELLPNQARTLKFRLTARDNRAGGGGIMHPDTNVIVTVVNSGGAFEVTSPNTALTYTGNSVQTITWNVSGTTSNGINTANVNILLSTDGGNTFTTTILASTANDGTENITVPNTATTTARIKVEAVGNIFFDMSNANFTITASAGLTTITTGTVSPISFCAGLTLNVPFTTNAAANSGNVFTAQLSDASGSFASAVNIGTLTSTTAGTISCTFPSNTPNGNGYRVRIVSSNPAVTGNINGANLGISPQVGAGSTITTFTTSFCGGLPITFNCGAITNATIYNWSVPVGAIISSGQGTQTVVVVFPSAGLSGAMAVYGSNANCSNTNFSTLNVTANPVPSTPTANTISGCSGIPITLSGSPAGGSFSVANPYSGSSTTFTYTVINGFGCTATSEPANITVNLLPAVSANNVSGCQGTTIALSRTPAGGTYSVANPYTGASTTYTYTFTDGNGCSNTSSSASITVYQLPTVIATSTNASCGNNNGTATANASNGSSPYNYLWNNGATTFSITNLALGNYSVTVTDINNCIATASTTVGDAGTTTATFTASATTVCAGQIVTLTNTTSGAGLSYQWKRNSANINAATNNTYTFSPSGTAVYTLQVTGSCGNSTSLGISITANGLPTAAQGTVTANGSTTLCSGSSIVLDLPTNAGFTYQWQKNSVNIGGATNNTLSVNTAGSYRAFVYNSNGCARVSNVITTTVVSNITATISANGPTTICTGANLVLTALPSGAGYVYQWLQNGSNITGATNQTYSASTSGNYACAVSIGSCSHTSAVITVTAGSSLVPPINYTYANICNGTPVLINTTNYGAGYTFQWYINNTSIAGATNYNYSASVVGNYNVEVNSGACNGFSPIAVLENGTSPTASFTATATTACAGVSITLSSLPVGTGYAYQWKRNGAALSGATNSNYSFAAGSSYPYTVTVSNNCGSSTAPTQNITVNPLPTAVNTAGGSTSFCIGGNVIFTTTTSIAGSTFQWQKNSSSIIGSTNASFTATTAGAYRCIVTSPAGCLRFSNSLSVVINCRNAKEDSYVNEYMVYPNPAAQYLTIKWTAIHDIKNHVTLLNILGETIHSAEINSISGANNYEINLTNVIDGIYFLRINNDEGTLILKRIEVLK